MRRFKARLEVSVELDAFDKHEAFDVLRDFSDAVEDGDGAYIGDLFPQFMRRVRVNIATDLQNLHSSERETVLSSVPSEQETDTEIQLPKNGFSRCH
jgi:hypothetical protein